MGLFGYLKYTGPPGMWEDTTAATSYGRRLVLGKHPGWNEAAGGLETGRGHRGLCRVISGVVGLSSSVVVSAEADEREVLHDKGAVGSLCQKYSHGVCEDAGQ